MDDEILQNDRLLVTIDPTAALASIQMRGASLIWDFRPSLDADVVVRHVTTEISAYLREANSKRVRRVKTV